MEKGVVAVVKLVTIDGKVAAVLPPEVLAELNLSAGDAVTVAPAPAEERDDEFERQMSLARQIMRERHTVLRALAQ